MLLAFEMIHEIFSVVGPEKKQKTYLSAYHFKQYGTSILFSILPNVAVATGEILGRNHVEISTMITGTDIRHRYLLRDAAHLSAPSPEDAATAADAAAFAPASNAPPFGGKGTPRCPWISCWRPLHVVRRRSHH
jgi:hypothetical protein